MGVHQINMVLQQLKNYEEEKISSIFCHEK
jgi:hypothetical protein